MGKRERNEEGRNTVGHFKEQASNSDSGGRRAGETGSARQLYQIIIKTRKQGGGRPLYSSTHKDRW